MNWNDDNKSLALERDLVSTPDDCRALAELKKTTASWPLMPADEIERSIPDGALDRRPTASDAWEIFTLP